MKKVFALLLAVAMVFSFVACGKTTTTEKTTTAAAGTTSSVPAKVKVGFVHIGDENDKGYTFNHNLGTLAMKEELGLSDNQIITKWNVPEGEECATALRELAEEGCSIIFATSFGFEDYVLQVAAEYPDIQFCHATGFKCATSELKNVHNYFASIYEGRYLAGIAAGLKTKTNKLGYVGAFPFAEVISGYTAFYLGAKSVNPDVTMEVSYVNSWYSVSDEKEAAEALIKAGCDVISQHSDSTGPATAAEEAGVFHVGYNTDMTDDAPNASLISSKINWGPYVTYAVKCVLDKTTIDKDWCQGLAEGAVAITNLNTAIAAEGTQDKIDTAAAAIKAGTLHVFQGPLKDASGKVLVKDGEYYHESETASAPSWDKIVAGITVNK